MSSAVLESPTSAPIPAPMVQPPPTKKLRKGYAYELVPVVEAGKAAPPPPVTPKTPENGETRSSFGRVRSTVKKSSEFHYGDADDIVIEGEIFLEKICVVFEK